MAKLLQLLRDKPEIVVESGTPLITQNSPVDKLYVMKEGEVEVLRDRTPVCSISRPGSAFGELSALLDAKATATVIARKPSTFIVVEEPRKLLESNLEFTLEITRMLAERLSRATFDYIEELDDGESVFWANR